MSGGDEADEPSPGDMTPGASRSGRRRGGDGNPLERTDDDREREDADEYDSRDDDEEEEDYGAEVEGDSIVLGSMVTRIAPSHATSLLELDHQLHDLREGGALTGWAEALNDEPHDMHALVTRKELTARAFAMRTALLVRAENRRPMLENSGSESESDDAPQEDGFAADEFPQQPRWNRRRAVDMQAREGVSVYPPDPMPACRVYQRPVPLASADSALNVPAAKAIDSDTDGSTASRKKALALGGATVHETSRQVPALALRAVTGHNDASAVAGFAELELELRSVAFFDHPAFRLEDCLAMKLRSLYGAYDARVGTARAEIENLQDSAGRRTAKARELVLVGDGVAQVRSFFALRVRGVHQCARTVVPRCCLPPPPSLRLLAHTRTLSLSGLRPMRRLLSLSLSPTPNRQTARPTARKRGHAHHCNAGCRGGLGARRGSDGDSSPRTRCVHVLAGGEGRAAAQRGDGDHRPPHRLPRTPPDGGRHEGLDRVCARSLEGARCLRIGES